MEIDHLFIFTDTKGEVADQLVAAGFSEGSSRLHPGQGTINRKFYFANFFLEILWVCNEIEIKSDLVAPTQLWERSVFRTNGYSPFGLCLVNTNDTDSLFQYAVRYQPAYFQTGFVIDVLPHAEQPTLPWLFRLPFKGAKKPTEEPLVHQNGIERLTQVQFGVSEAAIQLHLLADIVSNSNITFLPSPEPNLHLIFDNHRQGKNMKFNDLQLTISY